MNETLIQWTVERGVVIFGGGMFITPLPSITTRGQLLDLIKALKGGA